MIFKIKILNKDLGYEVPTEEDFDVVEAYVSDGSIDGVWCTPDLTEMHVYFMGNEISAEYEKDKYEACRVLVGHKTPGDAIS